MEQQKNTRFYMRAFTTLINIQKIVTVHYQVLEQNYVSQEEMHDFWELIYADKREITVVLEGKTHRVRQGEIIFLPPNAPHFVRSENKEPNIFIISFACRSKSMEAFVKSPFPVPEKYRYLLENVMSEAENTFILPDFDPSLRKLELRDMTVPGGEQIIKNSLELLLVYLLRADGEVSLETPFFSKADDSEELHDEIIKILSEKLYEKFTLDDLCEELHYGKTHLCTFFRKKTGASVYATYLKMRISEAKKLIRKGVSFTEISQALQFDSLPHFAKSFKKHTGMTPNEYRNSIQKHKI